MTEDQILRALETIIADIVDHDSVTLTKNTTADDVDGWNSMAHVRILVATEKHFGVRFDTREISSLDDVGVLVDLIAAKLRA